MLSKFCKFILPSFDLITQDEVVRKTQAFEKLKQEAERCLQQSERFQSEKAEFESAVYSKVILQYLSAYLFCPFFLNSHLKKKYNCVFLNNCRTCRPCLNGETLVSEGN